MKPIATVHWTDKDGESQEKPFYDMLTLSKFVNVLNRQNFVSYTTMSSLHAKIPVREPRSHITAV